MTPLKISIVLPCYNESGNIPEILKRYLPVAKTLSLELILVDNGSTDHSAEIFEQELKNPEYSFAKVVRVAKNIGYGHGIQTGLSECRAETVGYSHADLQCPPEDLLKAYHLYESGQNLLVKGTRSGRSWDETLVTCIYNGLSTIVSGYSLGDVNAQPKIFNRKLIPIILEGPADFSFDLFMLYQAKKAGISIVEMEVIFAPRKFGQSKWAHNPYTRIKTILKALFRLFQIRFGKKWNSTGGQFQVEKQC